MCMNVKNVVAIICVMDVISVIEYKYTQGSGQDGKSYIIHYLVVVVNIASLHKNACKIV